jgi:alanine-synthesizing transaminase
MFSRRTNWNLQNNRLSEALAAHHAAQKPLLDLTASNATKCGFAYNSATILQSLQNECSLSYEPDAQGLPSARTAVANYYADRGTGVAIEDTILTTSTSEGYSFVFRTLCDPGDEILIPEPSYPLFSFLADIENVKLVPYPFVYDHGWQIDFHALESAITPRTRGLIVVHPNNPTGHFTKAAEIARLNDICSKKEIALIADEVFWDFPLNEGASATFVANDETLTFTLSGISKISGLPQMKAAWCVISGPEKLKTEARARLEIIADTFLSMNAPVQLALSTFLNQRHAFQKQVMARVLHNLAVLDRCLAAQQSCTRLEIEGGWYAVLRVPATRADEYLAVDLLQRKNVSVHPGHFYDFPTDGYLVVSLITPEKEFQEGIEKVLSFF